MRDPLTILVLALLAPSYAATVVLLPFAICGSMAAQLLGVSLAQGWSVHPGSAIKA
jgi:hypothetical protein